MQGLRIILGDAGIRKRSGPLHVPSPSVPLPMGEGWPRRSRGLGEGLAGNGKALTGHGNGEFPPVEKKPWRVNLR